MNQTTTRALATLLLAATGPIGLAQDSPQEPAKPARPQPHFIVVHYPADREFVVAVVGERPYTLGDLVAHIEERHYPGFSAALERREFQSYLQSDLMAGWVRHFADIKALELMTKDSGIDPKAVDETISKRLKQDFEAYLARYVEDRTQRGITAEPTQQLVNSLLTQWQLHNGLATELQGWLDHLEPGDYTRQQLHDFYSAYPRVFGGQVTVAHILVQHRDGGTGLLLGDEGRGRASAKLAAVRAALEPDGSNFAEVARLYSDDTRTAKDGGLLQGIHRYDERMPAELCRAAWALRDGEISDVVESRYGWHILRRLEFNQNMFMLFTDDAMPGIKVIMQRGMQEELLFNARRQSGLQLRL